jgi:hypothetical protein
MNLENLNLVELNAQEVQEVDGGDFPGWNYVVAYHNANVIAWKAGLGVLAGIGDGIRDALK